MGVVFLAVVIAAYAEARRLVFLSHPEMQLLQMKEERGPIFDLNAIAGVKKHKWVERLFLFEFARNVFSRLVHQFFLDNTYIIASPNR